MIDAVFDTNILLQAALSDTGPAYACWEFVEAGAVRVWTTEAAMGELTDVLSRDKLRRKLNAAQPDRAAMILDVFRKNMSITAPPQVHFSFDRDPDDEVFINLAIEVNADFLVSRDRDLLDLSMNPDLVVRYPNLTIVNPTGFLEILRSQI